MIEDYVARYFEQNQEFTLKALGAKVNQSALDMCPFGQPVEFLDAALHPRWIEHYHQSNMKAFSGPLALPGWVLVDFYLMPGAIGLLTCPARFLSEQHRSELGLHPDDEAIGAAYFATPCVEPQTVMGCSLFSFLPSSGAARLIKAITLKMLKAKCQRGLAQWGNKSLWVHIRMGVLRLEGPVPASHGKAHESFIYSIDLSDEARWEDALRGNRQTERFTSESGAPKPAWIPVADLDTLRGLLDRAYHGERVEVLPPGLSSDGRNVFVRAWGA
jgi:hypothetical protein